MTTGPVPTPAALQAHARELATAFNVRLIEDAQIRPDEAVALSPLRVVLCSPVIEETTYAVVLHEIGHLAAPTGLLRGAVQGSRSNVLRLEEDGAWEWAKHYALIWTPAMDALATWARGTYDAPDHVGPVMPDLPAPPAPMPVAPPAPVPINWSDWASRPRPTAVPTIQWGDWQKKTGKTKGRP